MIFGALTHAAIRISAPERGVARMIAAQSSAAFQAIAAMEGSACARGGARGATGRRVRGGMDG